jgi:hypothetical protein
LDPVEIEDRDVSTQRCCPEQYRYYQGENHADLTPRPSRERFHEVSPFCACFASQSVFTFYCRSPANGLLLPDFYSGATGLSGRFSEGFSLRRLHTRERAQLNYSCGLATRYFCRLSPGVFDSGPCKVSKEISLDEVEP